MAQRPRHGDGVEQVAAVLDEAGGAVVLAEDAEQPVETRRGRVEILAGHRQAGHPGPVEPAVGLQQHEHDLEQGRVAEAALRLQIADQQLERQILVLVGGERDLPHPLQQLVEAEASGDRPQRRTRVLTKQPMIPSISRRARWTTGEPTSRSRRSV